MNKIVPQRKFGSQALDEYNNDVPDKDQIKTSKLYSATTQNTDNIPIHISKHEPNVLSNLNFKTYAL